MEKWIEPISIVVVSLVLPFVVALVKRYDWSSNTKKIVAAVMSLVVGIVLAMVHGVPTPETLLTTALAVVGGTQLAYALFSAIGVTVGWLDALTGIGSDVKPGGTD
jgi:hypothetical protein